jgi:hypothetical protein
MYSGSRSPRGQPELLILLDRRVERGLRARLRLLGLWNGQVRDVGCPRCTPFGPGSVTVEGR